MTRRLRIPNTLVLLFCIMVAALVSTWLLPQGSFQTTPNDMGRMVVVPGSYQVHEERVWLSPLVLFTAVPRALADAQAIIFFLLIVGGAIAVLRVTGVIDATLGWLLRRVGRNPALLIVFGTAAFTAGSATLGLSPEYIPFALVLITLCASMRLDAMVAMGMMVGGFAVGYGIAWTNPYTVLVAQDIAGIEPASGLGFRLALFLPFVAITAHHVWRYARKVAADPSASLVADLDDPRHRALVEYPAVDGRHAAIGVVVLVALAAMVYGISSRGWYLTELGAIWLIIALAAGLIARLGLDDIAKTFAAGASEMAAVALLVGFARAIALILEDGQVLYSLVHLAAIPLTWMGTELAAVGMLGMQAFVNFFIPSGSGQAFVTMPIMAPLADVVGVERQVAVLAFQFGDGFTSLLFPTNFVLMAILGVAGIPYERWFRFAWPLLLKLIAASSLALMIAAWLWS
ncbi:YfcC family protein [Luteimonas sp. R10]|uniref:YfcC family protein n=1 Tax=Luteimonas sp. R10 TaxID=3108176 RepID=UPI00308BE74C|nr:hypothetical protein U3649_15255 [Luteimonas sp. R10]